MKKGQIETVALKDFTNQNEMRVVGMSRSGNHSIINWIIQQLQGQFCFLNCAEPRTNPFYSARPLFQEKTYKTNDPYFNLESERKGAFSRKDYLIHSYEDCFLGMLSKDFEEQHDAFVGASGKRFDILILRDPFNLFASRKRSGLFKRQKGASNKIVTPLTAIRIWKQHAREFLGEKKHLRQNRILINYNLWALDYEYRKSIATALGLHFTDLGVQEVSSCAGGSSFDGLQYVNSAADMKVLDRWRHYINDQEYKNIFDKELVSLSESIFGPIPDQTLLSVPA